MKQILTTINDLSFGCEVPLTLVNFDSQTDVLLLKSFSTEPSRGPSFSEDQTNWTEKTTALNATQTERLGTEVVMAKFVWYYLRILKLFLQIKSSKHIQNDSKTPITFISRQTKEIFLTDSRTWSPNSILYCSASSLFMYPKRYNAFKANWQQ